MVTSQRYVTAAGTETRTAAAQNKLYDLLKEPLTLMVKSARHMSTIRLHGGTEATLNALPR
jgi:hypothetical protein